MKHIKYLAVPVIALGLGLSACATEEPAKKADDSSSTTDESSEGMSNEDVLVDEPEVVVEEPEVEEPEQPEIATLGDTMVVGDWEIKVTEVAKNANELLANENYYNARPKGQFVLVTYNATYTGTARSADVWSDLTWTLTTSDQQTHDIDYATTPADDESWPTTARKGGTIKGQVVFDVKPNLIKGGILSVEGYDADFDTVYADFRL